MFYFYHFDCVFLFLFPLSLFFYIFSQSATELTMDKWIIWIKSQEWIISIFRLRTLTCTRHHSIKQLLLLFFNYCFLCLVVDTKAAAKNTSNFFLLLFLYKEWIYCIIFISKAWREEKKKSYDQKSIFYKDHKFFFISRFFFCVML